MLYDRVRLKQDARAAMAHANPKTWLVTLVFVLLTGAVSGTLTALAPDPLGEYVGALTVGMLERGGYQPTLGDLLPGGVAAPVGIGALGLTAVFSLAAVVVSALFSVVMGYGYSRYALEVYRREAYAGAGSLFKGFPRLPTVVGASVLVGVFSFLWGLLIYGVDIFITALVLFLTDGSRVGTWIGLAVLFVIATLVHTLVTYRYCLTPYFVMDDAKLPASQAIAASVQAMKGNAWKRFVLGLSFLGWELLRWLITLAVSAVGGVFAFLIVRGSFGMIPRLDQGTYFYSQRGALLVAMAVAVLVVVIVAVLIQLPLELWLMSYENVSYAGFYQLLTGGQVERVAEEPATISASARFNNAQPVQPTAGPETEVPNPVAAIPGPEEDAPEAAAPEEPPVAPEEAVPDKATPEDIVPEEAAPEETEAPEEDVKPEEAPEPPDKPGTPGATPYTPFGGSATHTGDN